MVATSIAKMYTNIHKPTDYYMRWNNCMSTPIKMENGVKQGGVLSPTLFCINYTLMNCCEDYGKLM